MMMTKCVGTIMSANSMDAVCDWQLHPVRLAVIDPNTIIDFAEY